MLLLFHSSSFSGQLTNISFAQSKWSARWITIYKSTPNGTNSQNGKTLPHRYYSSKSQQQQQPPIETTNTTNTTSSSTISTTTRKGKFSKLKRIRKSWGWKAGAGWTIISVLDWWLLAAGGWLTWRGLFLKWTPIGIGIATFMHWHLHNQKCDSLKQPRVASRFMVSRIWLEVDFV